jgi:anti-sigma regulatory factor (Ser/Thr protein kinase)
MEKLLISFEAPLAVSEVDRMRRALMTWMQGVGFPEDSAYRVTTVVDELFCNTMEHSGAHWVKIGAEQRGEDVAVFVQDDGVPFDPSEAQRKDYSVYLESGTDRHLGLYLITRLAREVTYKREHGANEVRFLVGKELPDPMHPMARPVQPPPRDGQAP